MAKDRIVVLHSCGHEEEHLFTKSSSLNKRDAKWAAQRVCNACSDKAAQDVVAAQNERVRAAYPNLPAIEAVSDAQRAYAEKMRFTRLHNVVVYQESVCARLDDNVEDGKITSEMAEQAKMIISNLHKNNKAKFWLDLFEDSTEEGIHYFAIVMAAILYDWSNGGWDGIGEYEDRIAKARSTQWGGFRSAFKEDLAHWQELVEEMELEVLKG